MGLLDLTDECREAIDRWDGTVGAPDRRNRKKQRIRVFRNDFVENWLATSHPALPGVWFGGIILFGATAPVLDPRVGLGWTLGLFLLGALLWSLLEYVLHRWVFHLEAGPDFGSKLRMFMLHGYHHEFPEDPWRLVAPPLMSWPLAVVVGGAYYLLLGPGLWWPLFAGTCAGYLAYDWVHYYTHHARPKWRVGKALRRLHAIHHFHDPDSNHGISSPLWDWILRTYRPSRDAAPAAARRAR